MNVISFKNSAEAAILLEINGFLKFRLGAGEVSCFKTESNSFEVKLAFAEYVEGAKKQNKLVKKLLNTLEERDNAYVECGYQLSQISDGDEIIIEQNSQDIILKNEASQRFIFPTPKLPKERCSLASARVVNRKKLISNYRFMAFFDLDFLDLSSMKSYLKVRRLVKEKNLTPLIKEQLEYREDFRI